ncbi:MAG TPA: hypothetical protein PKN63_12485, partial [Chitinophagales bacterium]|nr:hypothetical protein [Chitinophagales bacterium]
NIAKFGVDFLVSCRLRWLFVFSLWRGAGWRECFVSGILFIFQKISNHIISHFYIFLFRYTKFNNKF